MPFRERLGRLQGKPKGALQARADSDGPAAPITSPPNINDVVTSGIEGFGTSAPTLDPQPRTQSPLLCISALSPSHPNLDNGEARATALLLHTPDVLPELTQTSCPQDMGTGTPAQAPGSTLSSHQRPGPPSGGSAPEQAIMTPDDPSRIIRHPKRPQSNEPTISPTPNATSEKRNDLTEFPSTQRNPQASLGNASPITGSVMPIRESNPAPEPPATVPKNARTPTWECLNRFRRALKGVPAGFGPLGPVIDGLSDCFGVYEDVMQSRQDYQTLKSELELLFSVLSEHFSDHVPPTMTAAMNNICAAIETELDRISTKEARGRFRLYQEADKDLDDIIQCYQRVHAHLERLKLNADLSTWKTVDKLAMETGLKSLLVGLVLAACYDSAEARELGRRECTPETRKKVLTDLNHWRHDKEKGNIYWLNGMAGTGKTTIASSLCAMLDKSHELGASFFCSRLLPHCRDIKTILPAIAYQLARYSHPFCCALLLTLQEEPDLHSKSLLKQIEGLIVKPLHQVAGALPADIVVVMDALDECDDSQGVGLFLELLLKHACDLPIKVFVSSRPEPRIRRMIGDIKSQLILHELDDLIVKEDIKLYLQVELNGPLQSISNVDLMALADKAGTLFIYAATVVRFIRSSASVPLQQKRLEELLGVSSSERLRQHQVLDTLYDTVLSSAFDNSDLQDNEREVMKLVLGIVICAQEPLTVKAITKLLVLEDESLVQAALDPLWSVLHIYNSNGLVTTLHASFPEYMLDPTRSKRHICRAEILHGQLAKLCFDRIKSNNPQFNVCRLGSSFIPDDQVPNLEERVVQAVPHELMYACQYWALHLGQGETSVELLQELAGFVSERLLLWMEILNLRKRVIVAASMLLKTEAWCKACNAPQETKDMVHDAWRFATVFATSGASCSTPHLYVSMLASWTSSGQLLDKYKTRMKGLVCVEGAGFARRKPGLLSTFQVGSKVMSLAFSANGMRIAAGLGDNTIRVWDAFGGATLTGPITGHTSSVNSVTFSPDSLHILSGSDDKTIRVWDATNGKSIVDPITGHTSAVTSVSFSPDGMRIASGSEDKTLRVWDAKSGKPTMDPITGHTSSITSVMFSPDGMRIVSGSGDKTVRVWDATNGRPLVGPIVGHTSGVTSVAFSPDGTRIVSGSRDETLRVWNAKNGNSVLGPMTGHMSSVISVAFSPDGAHIVSGSSDYTISTWEASSGKPLVDPITGHGSSLCSVAVSPDGMRIVSGACDSIISVWEPASRKLVVPLEVPSDWPPPTLVRDWMWTVVDIVRDIFQLLWGSITSRHTLARVTEHGAPITLDPLLPGAAPALSVVGQRSRRARDKSEWNLTKDIIQTVLNRPPAPDWCMPVYHPWSHLAAIDRLALCPGKLWVQHANEIRAAAGLANKFLDSFSNWYYLLPVLDALDDLIVFTLGQALLLPFHLLSKVPPINNGVMWVRDLAKVLIPFKVPSTCLKLLFTLLEIVDSSIVRNERLGVIMAVGPYLIETLLFNAWMVKHSINSTASSPDGAYIVSGSDDATVRVWDVMSGVPLTDPIVGHTSPVTSVAFSPDGTRIVSGSRDQTLRVWNAKNGNSVLGPMMGHTSSVISVAFSPDGMRIVSGSYDNTIRVWDATNGVPAMEPIRRHASAAISVAFSSDGMRVVSGHLDDMIYVWDTTNGQKLARFCCQCAGPVRSVAFLSDDMHVVSFSGVGTVLVWDPRTTKVERNQWLPSEEGWVVDNQGNLLLWLPDDLHRRLLPPQCLRSVSTRGLVTLNFDGAKVGDLWTECYICE